MNILLTVAKSGSAERWDALPSSAERFDKAKEGKALNAKGKKKPKKKRTRSGIIDSPQKGTEMRQTDVSSRVGFP